MARFSTRLGLAAALVLVLGPVVAFLGVAPPMVGFGLFALAIPLALVGTVLAILAIVRGPAASRSLGSRGLISCLLILAVVVVVAARGGNYPRINDITTDTETPPEFVHAQTLPQNQGRDLAYPGADFARQQREGYKDLAPLQLAMPADQAFELVLDTARQMDGWTITEAKPETRILEGVDTTAIFRFQDDFVIEVREEGGASVVQMRSKSRDGRGDIGANAIRIRAFFDAVDHRVGSS